MCEVFGKQNLCMFDNLSFPNSLFELNELEFKSPEATGHRGDIRINRDSVRSCYLKCEQTFLRKEDDI